MSFITLFHGEFEVMFNNRTKISVYQKNEITVFFFRKIALFALFLHIQKWNFRRSIRTGQETFFTRSKLAVYDIIIEFSGLV